MKNKLTIIVLTVLSTFLIIGWFYWFQWRPSEIRKECFREAYSEDISLEWAEGKEWMYYYYGDKNQQYGWLYPYWRLHKREDVYKGCLLFRGLK